MKIDKYMKVDFHIHSAASKTKKGDIQITKDGIFSNIDVRRERMNDSEVNIFSFTDHNIFDYNLYKKVKEYIAQKDFRFIHILRIFPGIEFDLNVRNNPERIHATCIFKDDDEKVRKIPDIIAAEIKDKDLSSLRFNETQLTNIIRTINLDFILIVHQKSDIQNDEKNGDNDFSLLDENTKDELIYYDFFTMYESNQHTFRFRFEDYKKQKGMSANFITGTDCHTWAKYPDLIKNPGSFGFSYIKCDDTFDGLKIAFTGNG